MVTISKLKKKLKGIGCVPPPKKDKGLRENYMMLQDFMASEIDTTATISAAFFAATFEEDAHWGLSTGILSVCKDKIIYAAGFKETNDCKKIVFPFSEIKKIALVSNRDETGFAGIDFDFNEDHYAFLSVGRNIPPPFLGEIMKLEMGGDRVKELLKRVLG